jgi:hypothetical protein
MPLYQRRNRREKKRKEAKATPPERSNIPDVFGNDMLVFKRQVQQLVQIRHGYNHRNATEAAKLSIDRSIAAQIGEREKRRHGERERERERRSAKCKETLALIKKPGRTGRTFSGSKGRKL